MEKGVGRAIVRYLTRAMSPGVVICFTQALFSEDVHMIQDHPNAIVSWVSKVPGSSSHPAVCSRYSDITQRGGKDSLMLVSTCPNINDHTNITKYKTWWVPAAWTNHCSSSLAPPRINERHLTLTHII